MNQPVREKQTTEGAYATRDRSRTVLRCLISSSLRGVSLIMATMALFSSAGLASARRAYAQPSPALTISPAMVIRGQPAAMTIRGTGFAPNEPVFISIRFVPSESGETLRVAETTADTAGSFTVTATIPPLGASAVVTERYIFAIAPSLGGAQSREAIQPAQQPITIIEAPAMPRTGVGGGGASKNGRAVSAVVVLTVAMLFELPLILALHRRHDENAQTDSPVS